MHRTSTRSPKRWRTPDLLGWIGPATAKRETRGTAHFTPPALARTIVERALSEVGDIRSRLELTVMDPACGSGSFLYEAIRAIRRMGFQGRLNVIGRDVSAPAVSMARFVLSLASSDWTPGGGMKVDLAVADSLRADMPKCDVLLMNPPFLSWNAMPPEQRDVTRQLLGGLLQSHAYGACLTRARSNTVQLAMCEQAEMAGQDARLNKAYQQVMSQLAKDPSRQMALRSEQRSWLKARDYGCKVDHQTIDSSCVVGKTAARANELERMIRF